MIDSARIFYEMLEQLYAQDNMEEVEHFLIREANRSQSCGYIEVTIAVMGELGTFYRKTGNFNMAVNWLNKSKYIVSGTLGEGTSEYAEILANLADTYRLAGEYGKAASCFMQTLKICEDTALTQTRFYAGVLGNLSLLYQSADDIKTALVYGEQALQLFRVITGASHETAAAYSNLADLYEQLGMQEKLLEARKRSEEIIMFLK